MPTPYKLLQGPQTHLATLSSVGLEGALLYTTDTQLVYVGTGTGTGIGTGWLPVAAGGVSGVAQIVAGSNVTVTPSGGTGVVTVAAAGGGSGGVSQIIAGTNVTVTPSSGLGAVTVNAAGGSGVWPFAIDGGASTPLGAGSVLRMDLGASA